MQQVKRKVIVVAGGTGGIGSAASSLLLEAGATVVIAARQPERKQAASMKVSADLRTRAGWQSVIAAAHERFSRIDVLINCVGALLPKSFDQLTEEEICLLTETNFLSAVWGVQSAIPFMRRQGSGHIIQVGSLGGGVPMPYQAVYSGTKYGVRGFCLSLHRELQEMGITLSLITPGPVETAMLHTEAHDDRAIMSFLTKPIAPVKVAAAIVRCIRYPGVETVIPACQGRLSMAACLFPALFNRSYGMLHRYGRRMLLRYRSLQFQQPEKEPV